MILNSIRDTSKTLTFKPRTAANINANGKCNAEIKTLKIRLIFVWVGLRGSWQVGRFVGIRNFIGGPNKMHVAV